MVLPNTPLGRTSREDAPDDDLPGDRSTGAPGHAACGTQVSPVAPDDPPPNGYSEGAAALAERLRALIAAVGFPMADCGPRARLTVSVAAYPATAHEMDDLVACADAALYAAKRTGKDLVQVYSG